MFELRLPSLGLHLAPIIILLQLAAAQHNAPLGGPPSLASSSTTPTSGSAPSAVSLSPAALSSAVIPFAAIPTFTDSATPTVVPDDGPTDHSVLNFYFFFFAIFIIAMVVLYWFLRRKRKRIFADAARRGQNALAADLERWPGDRRERQNLGTWPRTGRWHILRPARPQEGLNERGEAPPAYVAKPEPAHSPSNAEPRPPEWMEMAGKPPDYEETRHA